MGCYSVGSSPVEGETMRPCMERAHIHHMQSRGAREAGPSHAYGPFRAHCILLHGCTAVPRVHKAEVENLHRITENDPTRHGEHTNLYLLASESISSTA